MWPPLEIAAPVDVDGAYQRFARLGYNCGAFRSLTAMAAGIGLFADVAVPDDVDVTLSGFRNSPH